MTHLIPTLYYILGLFTGIGVTILGMYLGFKVSYDIRNAREGTANNDGLIRLKEDPKEFELMEDEEEQ